jgi:DNA-binding NarL/FixJ family response regulator
MLVEMRLRHAGADVVVAADVAEVRALLPTARRPDLVLLDLELPDGDGLALAPEFGVDRCLAFTASDDAATRERCLRAGLAGVLDKTDADGLIRGLVACLAALGERRLAPATARPVVADAEVLHRRYLGFLTEQRAALGELLRDGDAPTDPVRVRSILHRLCGTAVHFGLPEIGHRARALSRALQSGDGRAVRLAWRHLDAGLALAVTTAAARAGTRQGEAQCES